MSYSTVEIWIMIAGVALGTYLLRFSFLGVIGDRDLPEWVLRHLRYVTVAVMPALIAPWVLWPEATGGEPDAARLLAAFVTCAVGVWRRNLVVSVIAGMATLYAVMWVLG